MKCCDMSAAKLRTSMTLQRPEKTPDGAGGWTVEWVTYANVKGHVAPLSGFERLHAERLDASTRIRSYIRYRSDVLPKHRAVIEGRAHQIRAVLDLEMRKRWLELDLEQGVAT